MSYFQSLRFKLMLLAVLTGVSVSIVCIGFSTIVTNRIKNMAAEAYLGAAAGADGNLVQALQNITLDTSWATGLWVIVWITTFAALYIPVTISISRIIKPLKTIAKYADYLSEGNVYFEVKKDRNDEIGVIQESFQKLVISQQDQAKMMRQIAEGDLTAKVALLSDKDVIGLSLQKMVDSLNSMFTEINSSAVQVSTGAKQNADGAQSLAHGSNEQAISIERLSHLTSEIAEKTKTNVQVADKAANLADSIINMAKNGSRQMDEMMNAVREINEASDAINKIIKAIDDIAFQTNILALNAAVEAARAGSTGKGFAVVAEEVRNLASRSAEAAKETELLISNSMEKANFGSHIADETATSLKEIVSGINESSQLIREIARLSEEQSIGISEVNVGIEQVSQVVHSNSATAQESAAASEEMSGQSDLLEEMMSHFKLLK
jgi:methyl-accepting chemotaxis protein